MDFDSFISEHRIRSYEPEFEVDFDIEIMNLNLIFSCLDQFEAM